MRVIAPCEVEQKKKKAASAVPDAQATTSAAPVFARVVHYAGDVHIESVPLLEDLVQRQLAQFAGCRGPNGEEDSSRTLSRRAGGGGTAASRWWPLLLAAGGGVQEEGK